MISILMLPMMVTLRLIHNDDDVYDGGDDILVVMRPFRMIR